MRSGGVRVLLYRHAFAPVGLLLAIAAQVWLRPGDVWPGMLLFAGAILVARMTFPPEVGEGRTPAPSATGAEVALLSLVVVLALGVRVYRVSTIPAGLWLDETDLTRDALLILDGARPGPWRPGTFGIPYAYAYLIAGSYWLLGPGVLAVRVPALLVSALTTIPLYLLARCLVRRPVALGVTTLWATERWAINIGRWGHVDTLVPFFGALVLWLLWEASTSGRRRYWLACGVCLGLSQYTYPSARAFVPVVLSFLAYRAATSRGAGSDRGHAGGLVVMLAAAGLVLVPLGITFVQDPEPFLARSRAVSIFNPLYTPDPFVALRDNLVKYAAVFNLRGDPNARHNIPGAPMLHVIEAGLFVVGLGYAALRPWQGVHVLLLAWFVAFWAGGVLTTEAPNTFRIFGILPAILLLTGIVIEGVWQALERLPARWIGRLMLPASVALVLGAAWVNVRTYFAVQAEHPAAWGAFNVRPTRVGEFLQNLGPGWTTYMDREFQGLSPIEVLNPHLTTYRLQRGQHVPPPPEAGDQVLYVVGTHEERLLPLLEHYYSDGEAQRFYTPSGELLFGAFALRMRPENRCQLRLRAWASKGDFSSGVPAPRTAVGVPGRTPAGGWVVFTGGIVLPSPGAYGWRIEGDGEATVSSGDVILARSGSDASTWMPAGLVPIRIEAPSSEGQPTLWWRPPGADWSAVPPCALHPLDVPVRGLLAAYFSGDRYTGVPEDVRYDPLVLEAYAGTQAAHAVRWLGDLSVSDPGVHEFFLNSDDGSRLLVDGVVVADNWRVGGGSAGGHITLDTGPHRLQIDYFDVGGGYGFEARWQPPSGRAGLLADAALSWRPDDVRRTLTEPAMPQPPALRVVNPDGSAGGELGASTFLPGDAQRPDAWRGQNYEGRLLKLGSRVCTDGVGFYGPGELVFRLDGRFAEFRGIAGIDNDTYGDMVSRAEIVADGRTTWRSPMLRVFEVIPPFRVDVRGVQELRLRGLEHDVGSGVGDSMDWCETVLVAEQ